MIKRLRVGIVTALCLLCLVVVTPPAQGASVYFMAVNETLLPLEKATMPTMVEGVLYVPYTMLSADATGVNLGVYASYNSVKNRVLVFSSRKQLLFDLAENTTYEPNGRTYSERAIVRNSTVYLPIQRVCELFSEEIRYSVSATDYGYLVRVAKYTTVLSDAGFIDAAASMMKSSLSKYQQENPEGGKNPQESSPVSSGPSQSLGSGAGVYLAFTLTGEGSPEDVLTVLEQQGCPGLFFFTEEQLRRQDDLVRQLLGMGHFIGLRLIAEPAETEEGIEVLEVLTRAQELLADIAHCKLHVVLTEGLDETDTEAIGQAGFVCWNTTVDGRQLEGDGSSRAVTLMKDMVGGSTRNYLLLDDRLGEELDSLLQAIQEEDYQLCPPAATEL